MLIDENQLETGYVKMDNESGSAAPHSDFLCHDADMASRETRIWPICESNIRGLLKLNNNHALETSWLTAEQFRHLLGEASYARAVVPSEAMILAFDPSAEYTSPNFIWFRERLSNFLYIDRVIVSQGSRRQGLAAGLYEDLIKWATAQRYDFVVCEVNRIPPNPVSDSFHEKMGFIQVGEGEPYPAKRVRYLSRPIYCAGRGLNKAGETVKS